MRDSTTYLLGRASTPGVAETRQFLTRNGVPFQWVDVDGDPLVQLLKGRAGLEDRRYPMALFADGSILEGPERFMVTRYVHHTPTGTTPPVPPEDERAHAETARFKQQLAERVGLPTRPTRETYDVVDCWRRPRRTDRRAQRVIGRTQHNRGRSDCAWRSGWHKRSYRELPGLRARGQRSGTRGEHLRPGIAGSARRS